MKCLFKIAWMIGLFLVIASLGWAQGGRDASSFYSNSWAVVIGINTYQHFPFLEYAVNDAKAIESRFKSMGFSVISLHDGEATKKNILDVLKNQLPQKVGRNDRLVIFYAGHGAAGILPSGEEIGFIIPTDAQATIEGRELRIIGGELLVDDYTTFVKKANFISIDDIREVSDTSQAKHILYILDGCYSGFLDPAAYSRLNPSNRIGRDPKLSQQSEPSRSLIIGEGTEQKLSQVPEATFEHPDYLDVITARDTVQVLTAGSSGEQVYERSGHGLFTYYLLRALDGVADYDKDCVITTSELGTYLKQTVPKASDSAQSPLFNRISGEGEFIFIPPICHPIAPVDLQPPRADASWMKTDGYQGPKGIRYKTPTQVLVDDEDNLYVLDTTLKRIFKFDSNGHYVPTQFETMTVENDWMPGSMALGYAGDLWVYYSWQEKKKKEVPTAGKIMKYTYNGAPAIGWSGEAEPVTGCFRDDGTEVSFPLKGLLDLDIEDNIVIVAQDTGLIMKCDRNGKLLRLWGQSEKHEIIEDISRYKTVKNPQGMAVDIFGYIYIADTERHGIQKYFDGEWIPSWPNVKGNKPYFFDSPHGLAVDSKLYVYVADTENHRIKKYTSGGEKLLAYWGKDGAQKGKKYGEFNSPMGVAVNWDSTVIYVADTGNKRIQKFLIQQ